MDASAGYQDCLKAAGCSRYLCHHVFAGRNKKSKNDQGGCKYVVGSFQHWKHRAELAIILPQQLRSVTRRTWWPMVALDHEARLGLRCVRCVHEYLKHPEASYPNHGCPDLQSLAGLIGRIILPARPIAPKKVAFFKPGWLSSAVGRWLWLVVWNIVSIYWE